MINSTTGFHSLPSLNILASSFQQQCFVTVALAAMATSAPSLFVSHGGGPSFFLPDSGVFQGMGQGSKPDKILRGLHAKHVVTKPKAILVISAHFESPGDTIQVLAAPKPKLLFDYYGFPSETYKLEYPVSGDAKLGNKVVDLLQQKNFKAELDVSNARGLFVSLFARNLFFGQVWTTAFSFLLCSCIHKLTSQLFKFLCTVTLIQNCMWKWAKLLRLFALKAY
jgi:hypothetical protein